jgi:2',3'-cyclic-nucleotide 2'-phosphodiesterase (5'-nucleotidase family)
MTMSLVRKPTFSRSRIPSFASVFLLALTLLLLLASPSFPWTLTILHTNDLHGRLSPFSDPALGPESGGIARLATLIRQIRQENPETLLLDAGDRFSGTTLSSLFQGEAELVFASLLGYDALALGNHDFDYGQERLLYLRQRLAHLPFLAANILSEPEGKPPYPPSLYRVKNGVRILLVGLSTPETPYSTRPSNVAGLAFQSPARSLRAVMEKERGSYDLLIVLSHLGYEQDCRLAEEVPGIDLIVGGHSHTKIETPERIGRTWIVQAYQWGLYLGRVDLEIRERRLSQVKGKLLPLSSKIQADPLFASLVKHAYQERARPLMEEVVAHCPYPLLRGEGETVLGNLLADSFRAFTGADLALFNRGGIRADLPSGPITVGKIFEVLPFSNQVMTTELSGRQLKVLFDRLAARGGGDAISGARYRIHQGRAEDILIGDRPLESDRIYQVAANDFMMAGGDQFDLLRQGKNVRAHGLDRQALIEYLRGHPGEWPPRGSRIER